LWRPESRSVARPNVIEVRSESAHEPALGISGESGQKANQGVSGEESRNKKIWETTRWAFHDVRY
jgi:hypothetical protein